MSDALIVAIILAPAIITFILKSNAALAFLALCAGYTVQSFATDDINKLFKISSKSFISTDTISLLLVLVPLAVTLILCRGPSSRSIAKPKGFLNLFAALAAGAAFVLMAVPFFDYVGGVKLTDSQTWTYLNKTQSAIIGIGALLSLLLVWLSNRKPHAKDKKHHK